MDFRILGPLEVWDGGRPLALGRRKHRALLALLLLHAGEIVSRDVLIDGLWGERPPATAKQSLHNYVSQLRKRLGPDLIVSREPGYILRVEPEQIDLGRFEQLVARARAAASLVERASKLREAFAFWRGPALADLAFEPFALLEAPRLEELGLAAQEDLIDARLELGEHAEMIRELEALVLGQPFDERLRGQLMLALYRAGRQSDALDAYRQARGLLVDKLGLEPSEPLRELEQAILRQDAALKLPAPALPAIPLPTRRTATVLFADLVESSALGERLDAEALSEVLERFFAAMRAPLEYHGGTVEKLIGDAVMAVFGVPRAHEDDALRAIRAALDMREQLSELNDDLERERALHLEMRIGLNTGEVFAGQAADSGALVTGDAVHVAKRLEQAAPAGEILIGPQTMRLVREGVRSAPASPLKLGEEKQVAAFRLLELVQDAPAIPRRFDAPLAGREQELASLRRTFKEVRDERRCKVLTLLGEPGIGKTRLARELIASVCDEAVVLVGRCVSYGEGATYLPLTEMIEEDLGALLSGATSSGELFYAVRKRLEKLAAVGPLLLVFEDVHWAEPTLLDLIEYLGSRVQGSIFCLCLARPELIDARPSWAEEAITLGPLPEEQMQALVGSLQVDLPPDLRLRVVEVCEGNPLFAEQLVAHAHERGATGLDAVPPSVEALLASRLDLLDPPALAILQRAAVIGREFSAAALKALLPSATDPSASLDELERKGIVHMSDRDLRFHHVLVREVAYAGIPKKLRAQLHGSFAEWLEQSVSDLVEFDEIIGYHWEQAYLYRAQLGSLDEGARNFALSAARHLAAAGRRAFIRDDSRGAAGLLGRVTSLLTEDEDERLGVQLDLGIALSLHGQVAGADAVFTEVIEKARARRARGLEWRAIIERSRVRFLAEPALNPTGDMQHQAERAASMFQELDDDAGLAAAYWVLGGVEIMRCRFEALEEVAKRAIAHAQHAGAVREELEGLRWLTLALVMGPTPVEEAIKRCEDVLERARREARGAEAQVLGRLAELNAMSGRSAKARRLLACANSIASDLGERYARGYVVEALVGDMAAAEQELRSFCDILRERGAKADLSTYAGTLARLLAMLGREEEAESFAQVSEESGAGDDVATQVAWRGARSRVLASRGQSVEAERLAREAVLLCERTDNLNMHGDALLDLTEVLRIADRPDDAVPVAEHARRLYEQKGNVVSREKAGSLVKQLGPTISAEL